MVTLMANGLAYSFFVITLPIVGRQLDFSDTNTSLILGLSALVITLVSPVWGWCCELWGRRKVILLGIMATTVFNVISAVIIYARLDDALTVQLAFTLLLSIRIINSLFTGGIKPAGQSYIADITQADSRAKGMGLMGAAFGIGAILGGIASMISGSEYLIEAYIVITVLLTLTSVLVAIKLPESQTTTTSHRQSIPHSLPYTRIWIFLFITFIGLTIFSLLQHVVALTLQDKFQLSSDMVIRRSGMTIMLTMIVMIITQGFVVRKLSLSPKALLISGALFALCTMILASIAFNLPIFIFSIALFGFGLGLLLPGNLAALSLSVSENSQAKAAGINGMGQGFGLAAGPVIGVILHKVSFFMPYLLFVLLLFAVLLICFVHYSTQLYSSNDS